MKVIAFGSSSQKMSGFGTGKHPSSSAQKVFAEELYSFYKKVYE
jgi:hypothetical protein